MHPELKKTLLALHIDYINFICAVGEDPAFNFWGIKTFKDYIKCFGERYPPISETGVQKALDYAAGMGYNIHI